MGIRSHHAYAAGMASIGLAFASWALSTKAEAAGLDRADRWGIFIGEWAPTFFALGVALRLEEGGGSREAMGMGGTMPEMERGREADTDVFDRASSGMSHPATSR
ncbi:hypothetical protein [Nonomuraea roseoviolacea]|uniref:DUF2637 domain-containing protein n=1 Tax=Nonomuraea roseoviolacea subsp. carminata TaxID=160689 RepID=A0ABT1K833_9ACTN|nr:hypothetical protein [Nonomuraea roseoviolacea]MCP2349762.1 hypothetical protein [Nonomuraea roseoviolacea subsp. carminata]